MFSTKPLPAEAEVVVIGGGSLGCSTLYHLQKEGINGVLLEKFKLTAGTTWHSAGLIWRLRPSDVDIQLIARTRDLVKKGGELEEFNDYTGFNQVGGLFIASREDRMKEYKRLYTIGKFYGIESQLLTPSEVKELYPLMNVDDVVGGLYSPGDGYVDPDEYITALANGCKRLGGRIHEGVTVTGFETVPGRFKPEISGVITNHGVIKTKKVALCGGVWSRDIAKTIGVKVPLCAMRHAYCVTDRIPGIRGVPNTRDHDLSIYLRIQGEQLQVGGYEANPVFWDDVDPDAAFHMFDLDYDAFGSNMEGGLKRVPAIECGFQTEVCGPESFTPDHKPLIGPVPEVKGLYLNCAFNSGGIMFGGGCGWQLARYIANNAFDLDMFGFDVRRFHPSMTDNYEWIKSRSHEAYAKNYAIVFPMDRPLAGRNMRTSAIHDHLVKEGCFFQETLGHERVGHFSDHQCPSISYDWFGAYEDTPLHENNPYYEELKNDCTFEIQETRKYIESEVKAARNDCVLFDQSLFGFFVIQGPDAMKCMQWVASANMEGPVGTVKYCNFLNDFGRSEADLAVTRAGEDKFFVTAGGGTQIRDKDYLLEIIQDKDYDVTFTDLTEEKSLLSVQGPMSRKILSELTDASLANADFPFSTMQAIKVAGRDVFAIRLTFVGELGWELHMDRKDCVHIYEKLMEVGKPFGLRPSGYRNIDALSAQKGYLHWHEDIRMDDSPLEANIGFVCKLNTDIDFRGRAATEKLKKDGLKKRLVCIKSDMDVPPFYGLEVLYRNGEIVGYLRRGDFLYDDQKNIGYGYVHNGGKKIIASWIEGSEKKNIAAPSWEIEVMGKRYPCTVSIKNDFDPKNTRIFGTEATLC